MPRNLGSFPMQGRECILHLRLFQAPMPRTFMVSVASKAFTPPLVLLTTYLRWNFPLSNQRVGPRLPRDGYCYIGPGFPVSNLLREFGHSTRVDLFFPRKGLRVPSVPLDASRQSSRSCMVVEPAPLGSGSG